MTTESNEQLELPLARSIVEAHKTAVNLVEDAKTTIDEAINANILCASLVDAAKAEWGGKFSDIWRKEVGLPTQDATRYLAIHKSAKRRIDKRQLFLIGIIDKPEEEQEHHQRRPDPFAWCRWVPKVREALSDEAIERMDDDQREVARKTLEPMVELYNKLA